MAQLRYPGQSGQIGQTDHVHRSERSVQISQITNWTTRLHISRRDNRNTYIEHPIQSPDEGVTPPGRPAPRSNR